MAGKSGNVKLGELAADVRAFDKLEHDIHVKGRLSIISVLAAVESLTFVELRDLLGMTDGNLMAHLRALEAIGYTRLVKQHDGKPVTVISLTGKGRAAFRRYLDGLEHIVKRHR